MKTQTVTLYMDNSSSQLITCCDILYHFSLTFIDIRSITLSLLKYASFNLIMSLSLYMHGQIYIVIELKPPSGQLL